VKFGGVDELHAAFLNESRTRGCWLVPRTGNPGHLAHFRETNTPVLVLRDLAEIGEDAQD
jgi:hypothetical protein